MANTGVRDRVANSDGVGIPDLFVGAFDVEVIARDKLLENSVTAYGRDCRRERTEYAGIITPG